MFRHEEQKQSRYISISRNEHNISRKNISENALKVLYRLNKQGYEAYLVGGCIRDLLLGKIPKDFDITTNATPEQVHNMPWAAVCGMGCHLQMCVRGGKGEL